MNDNIKEVNEIVEKVLASKDIQQELMYRKLDQNLDFLKRQKAYEEGCKEKQLEMAKKMKSDKLSLDTIMKYTGLTKEEIEKI
jgi:predicted transposase/invertase (TIGR01784 family)